MVIATFKENGMRKILVIAGLAVLSTSAMASSARLKALGQSNTGSLFIDDSRNSQSDASVVNTFKDYVITEWGTNTATAATAARSEGGFFKSIGSLNYGAYMNSDFQSQNGKRTVATGYAGSTFLNGSTLVERKNNLDLYVGGDMGVQWGARLSTASNKGAKSASTSVEGKQSSTGVGLGVMAGAIGGYVNLQLSDKSSGVAAGATTEGVEWKDDASKNLGASYAWGDYKFYGDYNKFGYKYKSSTAAVAEQKTSQTDITIGVAKTHKVSGNSKVWCALDYSSSKMKDTTLPAAAPTATQEDKKSLTSLPATIAFEVDAASWLTWRGSVKQAILINKSKTETGGTTGFTNNATPDSTSVAAGATLNFGKLMVDGTISAAGALRTDALLSNVAVHYWF
jgi:hypothetical protein